MILAALVIILLIVLGTLIWWASYAESLEKRAAAQASLKGETPRRSRINRWIWTSCMDEETCQRCRDLDGKEWKRRKDALRPPLTDCLSVEGCRCDLVSVYDDEGKTFSES